MKDLTHGDVLLRPVVTEKTLKQSERTNTYTFRVKDNANKIQIRNAIESIFKVKVEDVRTHHLPGKRRRLGRYVGTTGPWKKAVVRVQAGQTIDFY